MTQPTITNFYTIVQNISPTTRTYGYLGARGATIPAGGQYSTPGNLIEQLAAQTRSGDKRRFEALERDLAGFTDQYNVAHPPTLAIVSTPNPFLYDAVTHRTKLLVLSNGTLGTVDPATGAFETLLTATFGDISSPTSSAETSETVVFSQPVTGFTVATLKLTRGGTVVPLTGVTLTTSDHITWTINGLSSLTGTSGVYILSIPLGSGIVDADNNTLLTAPSVTWTHS